ncbi:3'(2'),5'-bisphosphate nucleotidase CysQ [soil metagenome]
MNHRPFIQNDILESLVRIAREAADVVMAVYASDFTVRGKSDASPVTEADEAAEAIIVAALRTLTPDITIVAEEAVAAEGPPAVGSRFWLVDPLDGTREFVSRNGEFTVNIALIEHGEPVMGVVFAPALGLLYAGAIGLGAFIEDDSPEADEIRRPPPEGDEQSGQATFAQEQEASRAGHPTRRRAIHCRAAPSGGVTCVASRSHGDADALDVFLGNYLDGRPLASLTNAGSSLKLCLIAAGEADLYPRLGRTMEWDIAAGHAVLAAAGGQVRDLEGEPLRYGKPGFENPHFVASGLPG